MYKVRRVQPDYAVIMGTCAPKRVEPVHTARPCIIEEHPNYVEQILYADTRIMHQGLYANAPVFALVLCAEQYCPDDSDISQEYGAYPCAPNISPELERPTSAPLIIAEL